MSAVRPDRSAELLRRLAEAQEASLADRRPLDEAARSLIDVISARPERRRRGGFGGLVALAGAAAAVALAVAFASWPAPRQLRFAVGPAGSEGAAGTALVARARSDLPLRFSDGSLVTFRAGATGRVQRLDGAGAEIRLETGGLEAHVVAGARTLWSVLAGPFAVRVTGTRFTVDWSEARGLTVAVFEGSVDVRGGVLGAGVALRAGQWLRVEVASGLVTTEPLEASPPVAAAAPPAGDPAPAPPPARRLADPRGPPAPAAPNEPVVPRDAEFWVSLAERGAYDEALRAAERAGFATLCRTLDPRGLLALGDAARYAQAPARARQAWTELVDRFGGDPLAADAAFSLGRLALEGGSAVDAARWFAAYVERWPGGALAEQAAGRWIEAAGRAGDESARLRAARVYLDRYPGGPYASRARDALAARAGRPRATSDR